MKIKKKSHVTTCHSTRSVMYCMLAFSKLLENYTHERTKIFILAKKNMKHTQSCHKNALKTLAVPNKYVQMVKFCNVCHIRRITSKS